MTTTALTRALNLIAEGTLMVDAEGRIWRHAMLSHGRRIAVEARRAESVGGKGYLRLMLQIEGRLHGVGAHRVVWAYFHGTVPLGGMQINHRDLNKQNNRPENLELVTGAENIRHSYAAGRTAPWSNTTAWRGKAKLTAADIAEARAMRGRGEFLRAIAARFGIGLTHAQRITS